MNERIGTTAGAGSLQQYMPVAHVNNKDTCLSCLLHPFHKAAQTYTVNSFYAIKFPHFAERILIKAKVLRVYRNFKVRSQHSGHPRIPLPLMPLLVLYPLAHLAFILHPPMPIKFIRLFAAFNIFCASKLNQTFQKNFWPILIFIGKLK